MDLTAPDPRGILRATMSGDGRLGPIEERIGRRLIRLVDPHSEEGHRLLTSGAVDLLGPEGEHFGRVHPAQACRLLRKRLEERLAASENEDAREALREGLRRLQAWTERVGHA
jgi:hypothetical protein